MLGYSVREARRKVWGRSVEEARRVLGHSVGEGMQEESVGSLRGRPGQECGVTQWEKPREECGVSHWKRPGGDDSVRSHSRRGQEEMIVCGHIVGEARRR